MKKPGAPSRLSFIASSPLWTRAPARDEDGSPFIDFMMIIPGLKNGDAATVESCMVRLNHALDEFSGVVAYVDLNVKLNLLWISARPVPGITRRIVQAIQRVIPQAKVVAGDFNPQTGTGADVRPWYRRLGGRFHKILRLAGHK